MRTVGHVSRRRRACLPGWRPQQPAGAPPALAAAAPFGPSDVRTVVARFLQASMFLRVASSTPEKCFEPSLSMLLIPIPPVYEPGLRAMSPLLNRHYRTARSVAELLGLRPGR